MKDLLFMLADLWMIAMGFYFGWQFIRRHGNYLLGLEWMVVATSGTNFLLWAMLGSSESSRLYDLAYFLDAFSRSVGITLILVLGLMKATHRYKPSVGVEIGVFGLAIAAGLYLQQFRPPELHVGPASFYVAVNLLTLPFLIYFGWRLWNVGQSRLAGWVLLISLVATGVAVVYDFIGIPGDDAQHTMFYIWALTTWGAQLCIYYFGYSALQAHSDESPAPASTPMRGVPA